MTTELDLVLENPRSVEARRGLARRWREDRDPRADLIEKQLAERDGLPLATRDDTEDEIQRLIDAHGAEWAGRIAELSTRYVFQLGLVSTIELPGDRWLHRGSEIVRLAPIVRLGLESPVDLPALAHLPSLANVAVLFVAPGPWLNDESVEQFAKGPYVRNLRALRVTRGNIGARGARALASSSNLPNLVYADLTGNPCQHSPDAGGQSVNERFYIFGPASQPYWDAACDAAARSYDPHGLHEWPPIDRDLCWY